MKNKIRTTLIALVLIASIVACNLPSADQVPPPPEVQTEAALTVQALLAQPATSTVQPVSQPTLTKTPVPTIGPTGTITPTYSIPMLTLREQTNCRAGPGQNYEVLFTYLKGVRLNIIGNYPQENYWLVVSKESPTGECWLWGGYADVTGSYWVVPSVTPPPTATIPPPKAPSIQWDYYCSYATGLIDITLKWKDVASNETGYRVLRNGQVIAELPADSTTYSESITLIPGEKTIYQIQAYNATGSTTSSPISFTC